MSKLALLLAAPALAVAGGVAVWNIGLTSEIDDLRAELAKRPAAEEVAKAVEASATKSTPRARGGDRMLSALVDRVDALENAEPGRVEVVRSELAPASAAAAAATREEVEALIEDLPSAYRTPEFHHAVIAVLDARDAERRSARREKEATRMTDFWLKELEVSDDQRADVLRLTLDHLSRRDEIRRGDDADANMKREQILALDGERDTALLGVLGQDAMDAIAGRRRKTARGDRRGAMGPDRAAGKRTKRDRKDAKKRKRGGDEVQ